MDKTEVEIIPETRQCIMCGMEFDPHVVCSECEEKIDDEDEFYCDKGEEHYCIECAEEIEEERKAEKEEKEKNKPLPGQLPMFKENGDAK